MTLFDSQCHCNFHLEYLAAGGAYLPIEIGYPAQQLSQIVDECTPVVVLTLRGHANKLPPGTPYMAMDATLEPWEEVSTADIPVSGDIDDLAYCVYSSGTTGAPKGIMCPHRGAVLSYKYRTFVAPYTDGEREACNVFFVWEMLRPLLEGATLVVVPDDVIYDPVALITLIRQQNVTRMLFTPSLIEAVLTSPALSVDTIRSSLQRFRVMILCGEVVTSKLRKRILQVSPENMKLLNLYSISECHDVSMVDLANDDHLYEKFCHTGNTLPGVDLQILREGENGELRRVPVGVEGSVYVSGPTLARGYVARPDLTTARFISRPEKLPTVQIIAQDADDGPLYSRMYDTGDVGRLLPNGCLEILGRHNTMQKVRGYSIELQAIEEEVKNIPYINASAVQIVGKEGDDKHIVAYVVLNVDVAPAKAVHEIRKTLKHSLQHYMVPSYILSLEKLPTHPISGKLDVRALPSTLVEVVKHVQQQRTGEHVECLNLSETEKVVATHWSTVLSLPLELLDLDESFFDLGGHSLLASQLAAALSAGRPDLNIRVPDLYKFPTIRQFSLYMDGQQQDARNGFSPDTLVEEIHKFVEGIPSRFDLALRAYWHGMSSEYKDTTSTVVGSGDSDSESLFPTHGSFMGIRVLLTGCTGFLGAHLLYELLQHKRGPVKIFCLVRATTSETPLERIMNSLIKFGLWRGQTEWYSRIEAIVGDLEVDLFGLREEQYFYFTTTIDRVIHCGAKVNLAYPYSALRNANVLSTARIIHFAMDTKVKQLTYVSTNAVFANDGRYCDDIHLTSVSGLETGYAQSKYVAERLVRKAVEVGLPAVIVRPGNIGGSQEAAQTQLIKSGSNVHGHEESLILRQSRGDTTLDIRAALHRISTTRHGLKEAINRIGWNAQDTNLLFFLGCATIGQFPDIENWLCELIPVDVTARCIVSIAFDESSLNQAYNVIGESRLSFREFFKIAEIFGIHVKPVSFNEFHGSLKAAVFSADETEEQNNILLKPLLELIQSVTKFENLQEKNTFNINRLHDHIARVGDLHIPPFDRVLASNYWAKFRTLDLLKSVPDASRPLDGKVALVTGSSGGIGAAIAHVLARAGANVCLAARRKDRIRSLSIELARAYSVHCLAICTDVTDRTSVQECCEKIFEELGPINFLVNNAGVMHYTLTRNLHETEWMEAIDVNIKGVLHTTAAVFPNMLANGGHIVNISSNAGRVAFPGLAVYTGTKFFVEGFSESLRKELINTGIKVTTVQPGDCKSEINQCTTDSAALEKYSQSSRARNVWLDPNDVAETVLWVLTQPEHVTIGEVRVEPRDSPA